MRFEIDLGHRDVNPVLGVLEMPRQQLEKRSRRLKIEPWGHACFLLWKEQE